MMKYILLFISVLALQSYAFRFDTVAKKNVVQDALATEKELLVGIAACSKAKKTNEILKCARPLMSEQLTDREIKKTLYWFAQDIKITSFEVCSASTTEFIPQRVKLDSKKILCGSYLREELDHQAVFFIGSDSSNKLKLINLRP
ncbi:MAG: hypothetical protein V4654_02985 [Bdellovibrionota bacterium]